MENIYDMENIYRFQKYYTYSLLYIPRNYLFCMHKSKFTCIDGMTCVWCFPNLINYLTYLKGT